MTALLVAEAVVVVLLVGRWRRLHRPEPAARPATPAPAGAAAHPAGRWLSRLVIRILFVDVRPEALRLDCTLVEPIADVDAGDVFTALVRLPHGIEAGVAGLFDRWCADDAVVRLQVGAGPLGPKADFAVGDTHCILELLASSRLRGVGGRS